MLRNLRKTIKGSIYYSFGNLSIKIIGLILLPIFTNNLSLDEYGALGILEVSIQILISTFGLGLWYAFERWYWDKDYAKKQKSIFFTILSFSLFIAVFLFFIIFISSSKLSKLLFDSTEFAYVLCLMSFITGLEIIAQTPGTLLRLLEKPFYFTLSFIVKLVLTLGFTIYFLVFQGKKIDGIYEAQMIGSIVYLVILLKPIIKHSKIKLELRILLDMIKYRLPLIFSSIFIIVLSFTDRYALKFLSGLSDVGIYSLGYKLANSIKVIIVSSVWYALTPLIYKMMDEPNNKRFYSKVMTYFTFGVMIFVLGLSLFGKEIVYLFARKPDYWDAFKIIPLISYSILFGMLKDVSLIGLNIVKKTKIMAFLIIIVAVLNLILNLILIPIFQYFGAALATLISQIVFFIAVLLYSQKYYPIPYEIHKVVTMILVGGVLYALSLLTTDLVLFYRVFIKSLLIISFPFVLYPLKFYETVELDRIKGAWDKWKNPLNWRDNIKGMKS